MRILLFLLYYIFYNKARVLPNFFLIRLTQKTPSRICSNDSTQHCPSLHPTNTSVQHANAKHSMLLPIFFLISFVPYNKVYSTKYIVSQNHVFGTIFSKSSVFLPNRSTHARVFLYFQRVHGYAFTIIAYGQGCVYRHPARDLLVCIYAFASLISSFTASSFTSFCSAFRKIPFR